jgi:uncharacterized protein YhfF
MVLNGQPGCIKATEVTVQSFDQVDARFAWVEGDDDRTLASWRAGYRRYFARQCLGWGIAFDECLPLVLECFELVWHDQPQLGSPA